MFRNNQTVDGKNFCDDLEAAPIPLTIGGQVNAKR